MQQTDKIVGESRPGLVAASALAHDAVVDAAGEPVGRVREIMLDVPRGRIAYVVLAFEDPAEEGRPDGPVRKLFAVPWEALRLDGQRQRLVIDTQRERLRDAPGFDPAHWPSMAQPTWNSALYEFYGVEPYRED
ncbi:MAG TPA: PRC-barrel domain-containing protein [Steroidobacteraceae bacterium]|jgi:sporulation protein YlmC with PRC-barrel domain|nr:PRC-barrel domain-containing protein [Steroidobacteraceae bacterium]